MLSKEFIMLVVVANVIAWPIAYYGMMKWLANFSYKTNIAFTTFLFAGLLALLIAILTVSYQAICSALKNPIDAIRYE